MAKKLVKGIYKVIEFLLGFIIILTILLTVRLASGPIEIKNLTPIIVQSMTPAGSGIEVGIKNAYLELALSRGRLLDIRLDELSVMDNEGFVLSVEKANVSFNPFWLLMGKVVLRDIYLQKPYIQMDLSLPSKAQKEARPLGRKLNRVRRYFEDLNRVQVAEGEVVLKLTDDASILLPNLSFLVERNDSDTMDLNVAGEFYFDSTFMKWGIEGVYQVDTKIFNFEGFVQDVDLSKMQSLAPDLKGVNLVLDIVSKGRFNLSGLKNGWREAFEELTFQATTQKAGTLFLPEPLNTTYVIDEAVIKGFVLPQFGGVNLENTTIKTLGQTAKVNAQMSGLPIYFKTKDFSKVPIRLQAQIQDIPMTKVPDLWPAYLGTDAHDWIKQNVTAGTITNATLELLMSGTEAVDLTSVLDVQNAVVRYMDEMPPVQKVNAEVRLTLTDAKIEVLSGVVNGVQATGGSVDFLELDKDIPRFDANVQFKGNIRDGMGIVAAPPLNVCDDISFSCARMDGRAVGLFQMTFPFDDLLEEHIKFSINADLEDAGVPVPNSDWLVSDGTFKLFVNNDKLTLTGRGLLDEKPMQLDVLQMFDDVAEHSSVYQVKMPVTASMIAPYFDSIDDFLKGSLMMNVEVRPLTDTETTVGLDFGLKDAEISLPIGYTKEFEQDGTLKATLLFKNDKLVSIPSVYLSIPDEKTTIKGRVKLPKDKVFEMDLSEIKAPKTNAKLVFSYYPDDTFDVTVSGDKLDVADLAHGSFFGRTVSEAQAKKFHENRPSDFTIHANVKTLYLSDDEPFSNVVVNVKKNKGRWEKLNGSLMGKVPFTFSLNEQKNALTVQTEDVGTFLKRAGYTDRIKGGSLNSTIAQQEDGSLTGEIKVKNYELTKTSFFVQAATLLGIMDALKGDTIAFSKAIIPFTLSPTHVVSIENGVASGTAVGITMHGTLSSEKVDLTGSVVPAYALNSLPGKIPVVGTLLSGEKGGGLFGVSYTLTGRPSNTEFSFNPASLLAPGIFRRLFNAF